METIAERLVELAAERTRLKTTIAAAQAGSSSFSIDGISGTTWRLNDLRDELTRVEKSIQRLTRGGRAIYVDHSSGASTSTDIDVQVTM
jgi:hypothetical protein